KDASCCVTTPGETADVTVLQNQRSGFPSSAHSDIYHRSGQVVGTNLLVFRFRSCHGAFSRGEATTSHRLGQAGATERSRCGARADRFALLRLEVVCNTERAQFWQGGRSGSRQVL